MVYDGLGTSCTDIISIGNGIRFVHDCELYIIYYLKGTKKKLQNNGQHNKRRIINLIYNLRIISKHIHVNNGVVI